MNAKQFAEKAIIEGMKREYEDVDDIAESLSAGLIVLTEERLMDILCEAYLDGQSDEENDDTFPSEEYASRIMREVKGGE